MKQGLYTQGFTILEVMIVLVVTSALAVSALILVSGQQQKTAFQQSINDIKQQIDQVINNVATGYYVNNGDINCSVGGSGFPVVTKVISPTTPERGANTGCILLGRAMQFGVNSDNTAYTVYGLAGVQNQPGTISTPVTQIDGSVGASARPVVIANSSLNSSGPDDAVERHSLGYGLSIQFMKDDTNVPFRTFAIVSDFAGSSSGSLDSGSRTAVLYSIQTTNYGNSMEAQTEDDIDNFNNPPQATAANFHQTSRVILCFASAGTDKLGIITIGSNHSQLTTYLQIANKTPTPAECT